MDKVSRQKISAATLTCACGAAHGGARCNPAHHAHVRNSRADTLAEEAITTQALEEEERDAAGELEWALARQAGGPTNKPACTYLADAVQRALVQAALARGSKRALDAIQAAERSHPAFMKRAAAQARTGGDAQSERFLVRLWCDVLPTYSILAKRIHGKSDSKTKAMYTAPEEDTPVVDPQGTCMLCSRGEPETLEHVLAACDHPALTIIRDTALAEAAAAWEQMPAAGVGSWQRNDWTRDAGL